MSRSRLSLTEADHVQLAQLAGYDKLTKFDIVITSYQIVAQEWFDPNAKQPPRPARPQQRNPFVVEDGYLSEDDSRWGPLFLGPFRRVILDEAHQIKNRLTKSHKACVQLASQFRWCLTGTPIQNNVEDMHSLFEFLGKRVVSPYHSLDEFKAKISAPLKAGRTKVAMSRLKVVLKSVMLRRTKDSQVDGRPLLVLPKREIIHASSDFIVP